MLGNGYDEGYRAGVVAGIRQACEAVGDVLDEMDDGPEDGYMAGVRDSSMLIDALGVSTAALNKLAELQSKR